MLLLWTDAQRTGWFPFCGVTKSGRVRRKELENEAWSLTLLLSLAGAVVMTYNPVAGHWSAQSTLAYLGPLLNLETKGANRDAFHVSFLHQDEPLGKYDLT